MNTTSSQLETISREITEFFADNSHISIRPNESNPPDRYTISYKIQGVCKEGHTDVYSCDTHVVSISLPFGFPHFPPNCLPESPTFHPDFDSSAICIGDVWDTDKSLVQLILHIAKMISGEIYSRNNAFNEEAEEWYNANSEKLPFDTLDCSEKSASQTPSLEKPVLDTIDTLGDDDFADSFSLEKDFTTPAQVDIDRLRIIAKQKRFQALSRELQTIEGSFDGRTELESQIQTAMDKAMALYQEADTLENKGEQQQALDKYLAVENLVADYPMIQEAKERVQQAFDLLGEWVNTADDSSNNIPGKQGTLAALKPDAAAKKSGTRTFFEDTKAVSKKWFFFALGAGGIALVVTLGIAYLSLGSSLERAAREYEECRRLLETNKFTAAQRKCDEALSLTTEIRVVKQNEKEELVRKINKTLSSPKLQQGLLGKTLYNGKYISKATKGNLLRFQENSKNGDIFFQDARWEEAVNSYSNALDSAKNTDIIDETQLASIREKLPRAQFNALRQAGKKAFALSEWGSATEFFDKALSLARKNPYILPREMKEVTVLFQKTQFNKLHTQGLEYSKARQWKKALESYQQALQLIADIRHPDDSDVLLKLHESIAKSKIYMAVQKGKEAFSASQWDDVIAHYEKAILLLEENSKLLNQINTQESRLKLSRMMLQAEIIKNKQDIAKNLKSENYDSVIERLEHIKKSITSSQFAQQEEFQTILQENTAQLKEMKQKIRLTQQISYLKDNFERLFLKHYPAASRSALSAPKVEFIRKIGNKFLFRMQCTETTGGRALRLQMDYLYSPANNRWSFYSEE